MAWDNIEFLVSNNGQINIGDLSPVGSVAVANDEHNTLAMLKRRPDESLTDLLDRLDLAILQALEYDQFTDEINS